LPLKTAQVRHPFVTTLFLTISPQPQGGTQSTSGTTCDNGFLKGLIRLIGKIAGRQNDVRLEVRDPQFQVVGEIGVVNSKMKIGNVEDGAPEIPVTITFTLIMKFVNLVVNYRGSA
jgi:hypothetical protein